ncbi:hypothetical protein HPHPH28_0327 [Helicobacter pylori Hp H-28]|nr:hypothetical protein HPHPH28_0327 [Helicobacter pylori Hp H-28]
MSLATLNHSVIYIVMIKTALIEAEKRFKNRFKSFYQKISYLL